jgi:chromosome segregation ATPase
VQEENLKLKLLDLEKKFVELEMSVSKINESLKTLEAKKVNEIVERFEEIEDLVLIENAAVSELKELLERSDTGKVSEEFQKFKEEIESKINSINSSLLTTIDEIKKRVEGFSANADEVRTLNERISKVEESLKFIPEFLEKGEIINNLGKIVKSHDELIEKINKELEEVKKIKAKVDEELKKRIPESLLEDFVKMNNEMSVLKLNISSLSKQLEEIYRDVKLLKPDLIKEVLSKSVEIKMAIEDRFKEINELVASISSSKEEIRKISILEAKINELSKLLNSSVAEIENLKASLALFSSKQDLEKLNELIESMKNEIKKLKSSSVNLEDYNQLKSSYISLSEETSKTKENLNKLSLDLELIRSSLEAISKNVSDLQTKIRSFEEISPKNFVRIEDFSAMVFDIKKNSQEIEKIKQDLLNLANRNEILSVKKEIEDLKKEFLSVKNSLIPLAPFQQVVNKIAYLEAKINEIEKRLETKVKPIILE